MDPQVCESCAPGYSLSNGLCESQCSLGQYSIVQVTATDDLNT